MTSKDALTGTDRVAEAAQKLEYDIFINVQGDEPILDFKDIIKCIKLKEKYFDYVINAYSFINTEFDPNNLNIPKVITNESDECIYISRSLIPGAKNKTLSPPKYKKQVCIYGFSLNELKSFLFYGKKSKLEKYEDIEILRFFELGKTIKMFESKINTIAVDIPDDILLVEKILRKNKDNETF